MEKFQRDPFWRLLDKQIETTMHDLEDVRHELHLYNVEDDLDFGYYIQALMYKHELEQRLNSLWRTKTIWEEFLNESEENNDQPTTT